MKVLSLFSGIGGIDLGLEWAGMTTIGQVEIDGFCNTILERHWPSVKRWTDIRELAAATVIDAIGRPDVIAGGFPCQDISAVGRGKGIDGERSGLWREMFRLIRELQPTWVLIENSPHIRTKGIDTILDALEGEDYTGWPLVVGADLAGAPQKRERMWLLAYSNSKLVREQPRRWGRQKGEETSFAFPIGPGFEQYEWEKPRIKPRVGTAIDGLPCKLAYRAIGNSVVPQIPYVIGKWMMQQQIL